jgi:AcrR family transcriptional regulator
MTPSQPVAAPPSASPAAPGRKPRRTQAERRQEAEAKLIEAGLRLVASKGVAGMTLAEVGEAAGFSRGIVAHHFGSKSAFLQALVESAQKRFYEGQRKLAPTPPGIERLLSSAAVQIGRVGHRAAAMNAMIAEAIIHGGELRQDLKAFTAVAATYYATQIQQAAQHGDCDLPSADTEALGFVVLSLLRGLTATLALLEDDEPTQQRVRAASLAVLERAVGIPAAAARRG